MMFSEGRFKEVPTVLNNTHESCYRASRVLDTLKKMIKRKDSLETMNDFLDMVQNIYDEELCMTEDKEK